METQNELRIARICWNTNNWVLPSGEKGKSSNKDMYESQYGFGHEEWLFDFEKIIDGKHYSFLQGVNKALKKYKNQLKDIVLYTKEEGGKPILIGMIKNVHCIDKKESKETYAEYKKRGWKKNMKSQVRNIGGEDGELEYNTSSGYINEQYFNISFNPKDVFIPENKTPEWLNQIKCFRYVLLKVKDEQQIRNTFQKRMINNKL